MIDENEMTDEIVENAAEPVASEVQEDNTSAAAENEDVAATSVSEVRNNDASIKGSARKDKTQYTDLEKAQYSFHKQLGKQKAKYERALAEREDKYKALLERIDRLENPDKYRPKTRNDFTTDDEYIDHIVQERMNTILQQQMEAYQKEQTELAERNEAEKAYRTRQDDNVNKLFPDEASRTAYQAKVDEALEKGLGELIDSDADLANYIIMSPMGPKLMYKLATDVNAVKSLFEDGKTPMDRQFTIRQMEQALTQEINNNRNVVSPRKPIGRPGVENNTSKDLFADNTSILKFLNSR